MGVSRRDHALSLMKRFRGLNAHILGVVVNSYRTPDDSDYGYYQYSRLRNDRSGRRGRALSRIARTP